MRTPFNPPYTADDIPQLDALHIITGLGKEWLESGTRERIVRTPTEWDTNEYVGFFEAPPSQISQIPYSFKEVMKHPNRGLCITAGQHTWNKNQARWHCEVCGKKRRRR